MLKCSKAFQCYKTHMFLCKVLLSFPIVLTAVCWWKITTAKSKLKKQFISGWQNLCIYPHVYLPIWWDIPLVKLESLLFQKCFFFFFFPKLWTLSKLTPVNLQTFYFHFCTKENKLSCLIVVCFVTIAARSFWALKSSINCFKARG